MSVLTLGAEAPTIPAIPAGGGTLRIRISPLVDIGGTDISWSAGDVEPRRMDMQQVLTNLQAAATRAAGLVRDDSIVEIDQRHPHPKHAPCLRCAVTNASRSHTVAATLLEILNLTEATEEWNLSRDCNSNNTATRLRRLAISEATLMEIYGIYWSEVMVSALRIENTDFAVIRHLIERFRASKELSIDVDDKSTRHSLAAYHIGTLALPRHHLDGTAISSMQRNQVLPAVGAALGKVATGRAPYWLDHLGEPAL